MYCPICDQKTINCDCTEAERRQFCEIEDLEEEIERLRLTDAELEAVEWCVSRPQTHWQHGIYAATLRGLLERHCPASEKRSLQDNDPSASENLPSGNDTLKMHCNSDKFTDR